MKKKYTPIFKDPTDKDSWGQRIPYSTKKVICLYPGCITRLNGYTVGRNGKFCSFHHMIMSLEKGNDFVRRLSRNYKKRGKIKVLIKQKSR